MTIHLDPRAPGTLSRRTILRVGTAAGGGLLLGFYSPFAGATAVNAKSGAPIDTGPFAPDAFIRIDRTGSVTLTMPQVEMGQGVYTSLSMILAEELDAAFHTVAVEAAPPSDALYGNPMFGIQATGNSNSVRAFWKKLRAAGAGARAILVEAAAAQWKVVPSSCTTQNSEVLHSPTGRKLPYGALVDAAAKLSPPADPPLKNTEDFKLIGQSLKRLDTPAKVNGKALYGIDMLPAGVKFATLAASPVFGGKIAHVDDGAAKSIAGVRQIVVLDDLVAVVGDHMWAAKKGLEALVITWDDGPNAHVDSAAVWKDIKAASEQEGAVAKSIGDAPKALKDGEAIEAHYELPFLAHAPMEPMNCTVDVRLDGCDVWVGTQVCARTQAIAAKVTGLPLEKVIVHNQLLGGGFGRRLDIDATEKALRIAQKVDGPVKVVWTREEDIRHDYYRPMYYNRLTATLKDGRIDAWKDRITGSSVMARWFPLGYQHGVDIDGVDSAIDEPYEIPNMRVEFVRHEPPAVPTGFWRGVGPNNNVFAIESFIDELAKKAGKDPVDFRLAMLAKKTPRLKAALEFAAQKAGWGQPLPPRIGRGVAVQVSFASFIATIAEVEVDHNGEVYVRRITSAVDTGIAVNPDTIVAQLQGGLIFGVTAALYGEITIDKGRVQQGNFNDYRMLRIDQAPAIDVHVIKSSEAPGGIGETGTTGSAAGRTQCNLRCDGNSFAAVAVRPGRAGREETRMSYLSRLSPAWRYTLAGIAAFGAIVLAGFLWIRFGPGPMDFAKGNRVALVDYHGSDPTGVSAELRNASLVTRGEYLARAADCEACHTAKGGAPFAGGLALVLPFGTIYTPNITPDKETGIGSWSDASFLNAIRKGIDDKGVHLYPAMPYPSYTGMTDADVFAIKAYLFSLKPVHADVADNTFAFPFNQRWLMGIWSFLFNPDSRFEPNTAQTTQWNRGAYLTENLEHCGECHTPRTLFQSLDNRRKFAGATQAGWRAYNITADSKSGVGDWREASLAQYLSTGHADGHGTAAGPMGEAVDRSLSHLARDDIAAIVVYLRSVPAISTSDLPAPKTSPAPASHKDGVVADYDPHGKQIFEGACASCHAWSGVSPLTPTATLTGARAVNDPRAINVAEIVLNGAQRTSSVGGVDMPAFGRAYSNDEIAAVANYVTARFGAVPSRITAREVAQLRQQY